MKLNFIIRYTLLFIVLILLQAVIFNRIQFGGYVNPYVYLLFVLFLPVDVHGGILLFSAFFMGLVVDVFLDSPGMHAAATLCMAFARPAVIRLISVRSDFEPGTIPGIRNMGMTWIITYSMLLILVHHVVLFFLEIFRLDEFLSTIYRIFLSALFTLVFIILGFFIAGKSVDRG